MDKPQTRTTLGDLIHKHITGGCRGWTVTEKSDAGIVSRIHTLHLTDDMPDGWRLLANMEAPFRVDGVQAATDYIADLSNRLRADGLKVGVKPWHTNRDVEVSMCEQCDNRPSEFAVDGRRLCLICAPTRLVS